MFDLLIRRLQCGYGKLMAWWNQIAVSKRITIYATTITAVLAAMVAVVNALNAGEPHWVATRHFVRAQVELTTSQIERTQQLLRTRQVQTEVQIVQGRIEQTRAKISDRELLIEKPEGAPPEYRRLIIQQVEEFKDQIKLLENQLDDLRRELVARRP